MSRNNTPRNPEESRLTGDRPAKSRSEDRFGWSEAFIPVLARVTREWPAQVGLTFGLYGAWGSGKTTVLNLLEEHLKGNRDRYPWTYVVRFNPWFYDDARALIVSFFSTLGETMATEYADAGKRTWSEAGKVFKKVGKFLAVASKGISIAGIKVDAEVIGKAAQAATDVGELTELFDKGERELQQQRAELETHLASLGGERGRVMVLIDDVDRLDSGELIGLLRLLRTVAELPAMTLIIAADEGRIRQVLDAAVDRGYGRAYLEKIVQAHMHVPLPDAVRMEELLRSGIVETLENAGAEVPAALNQPRKYAIDLLELRLLRKLIHTPRDLGRYLNGLRLLSLSRPAWDLDPMDTAHLAAVQVFFPDAYERIRRSKTFLTEAAGHRALGEDQASLRQERNRTWAWIVTGSHTGEPGPEYRLLADLVEQMFGDVVERQSRFRGDPTEARKIQSPEIFDSYFAYVAKPLWLSRAEVQSLVGELATLARAGNSAELASRFRETVAPIGEDARGRLRHDLSIQLQEVDVDSLASLGRVLEDLHGTLEEENWDLLWHAWLVALQDYGSQLEHEHPARIAREQAVRVIRRIADPLRALRLQRHISEMDVLRFFGSTVLASVWLERWTAYLASEDAQPWREFTPTEAAELIANAVSLEDQQSGGSGSAPSTRPRLISWLCEEPQRVVSMLDYLTDGRPLRSLGGLAPRKVQEFIELIGETGIAEELLRNAAAAGVDDPKDLVAAALEHLPSSSPPGDQDAAEAR